ncbi:MAG TPA: outer membrane beta-barrel protein [Acidobacteriaceae bacterium]|nr:outer membrane beta-barrel protein [Acidobacteriaceae bacterium]
MKKIIGILALILMPAALLGQSQQSAVGGGASLWAGADMATYNPDWGCATDQPFGCFDQQVRGPGAFFDFNVHPKWGAEGEARWLNWNGAEHEKISNYLLGGRYRIYRFHRFDFWGKALLGGGWITTAGYPEVGSLKGSYFAYVPGGEIEYRLTRRWKLHGGYEYEIWPSFANNGLTPNGFSLGVTYRVLGQ